MKVKSTKKALLSAVLSLIVCISMLVGSTFAWFTDSVTSMNNIIQSGNLDVVLEYFDTDTDKWVEVNENTKLFSEETLWEPGYTEVVYLKVSNAGSLALKYQLGVNIVSETEGKNQDGDTFKLSDHIYFGAVEDQSEEFADRDAARAAVVNGQKISDGYTKANSIESKGPADYVALVVYMPETVGNVANHNGTDIPVIKLGVNLTATQFTAEADSFDNMYDELASFGVSTADELLALFASGKDAYITLDADIELTETASVAAGTTVVLDLNGNTISGAGLNAEGKINAIVNNGTLNLVDGTVSSNGINGGSAIYNKGTMTLENVNVVGAPSDTTLGTASYAINTSGADSKLTVNSANVSGRGAIGASEGTKVVINGGTYYTPEVAWGHAIYADGNGTEVVINDGTFREGYEMAADNWGMYQIYSGNNAKVTVNGGTFENWDCANGYDLCTVTGGMIEIYGGTFADDPTNQNGNNYVAKGYQSTENGDGTWSVGGYKVGTAAELTEQLANGNSVVLTEDIDTEAATKAPYGNNYAVALNGGTLDGNGNELYMECYSDDYGVMTSGGTIKNITIKEGCRAVMIMYPQEDVILDNVNIGGDGVLYPINTGEAGASGVDLIVTNSVLAGWTSYSNIESASFTNVEFKQGTYYNNIYGRVLKPYVNTTLTDCSFVEHMNLDLSGLAQGQKVIIKNCTVNGQKITANTFTIPASDSDYDTELFTVDLPSWASSIADCIVFE